MGSYATVADLQARWRALSASEQTMAEALIGDAEAMICALAGGDVDAGAAKAVCCAMVKRAMSSTVADSFGLSQASIAGGPYSQSVAYANPSGDLFMTRAERSMLGIGRGKVGVAMPSYGVLEGGGDD